MKHTKTLHGAAGVLAAIALMISATGAVDAHDPEAHDHEEKSESIGYEESARNDALLIA